MHNLKAITKGDTLFIGGYEMPEPNEKEDYTNHSTWYERAYLKWQQSYKEHPVRKEDENNISSHIWSAWVKTQGSPPYDIDLFHSDWSKGIPCDELKDRLELKRYPEVVDDWGNVPCEWTLKPVVVEMEEIEAVEFAEWVLNSLWKPISISKGWWSNEMSTEHKTTKELYQIFKNRK